MEFRKEQEQIYRIEKIKNQDIVPQFSESSVEENSVQLPVIEPVNESKLLQAYELREGPQVGE